jgi:4,5-dihydroxyphthalate decarboxylase
MSTRFLKLTTVVVSLFIIAGCNKDQQEETLSIKIGGYDYDRVRAIMDGNISIADADVDFEVSNIYTLNRLAFGSEQTYEVTEFGLIPFITRYVNEDFRGYSLIPVFISREFRHKNVYVHVDSGIERPEDLVGKRVGTPGYGMSSHTWIRGFLLDEYGVKAEDLHWIETTKSSDGGALNSGFSSYFFGDDFPLTKGPEGVDESELLLSGQCDALVTAITPKAFIDGDPRIRQLFPNVKETEEAYFRKTGMFPIMHVIAIRKDVLAENPWLAQAVFEMYSEAKDQAYRNLQSTTVNRVTLPWTFDEFESTRDLMGTNYWKYGVEANRKELEAIMRYVFEQGLTKRQIGFEEMFAPQALAFEEDSGSKDYVESPGRPR